MRIVHSDDHRLRSPKTELYGGELATPFETPERVDKILAALAERGIGDIIPPTDFAEETLRKIHKPDYLEFLKTGWGEWKAAGYRGEMIPTCWPSRAMPRAIPPREIDGKVGYYALAGETSIDAGTWRAAKAAANVALTGATLLKDGEEAAFALCRPPGHHAAADMFGGYCFLNNAALAAQHSRDNGADRVAILDVDFHHGNGTQHIFYRRGDVLFLSLHGDPADAFPYFLGRADETGEGDGANCNVNYPLPPGAGYDEWSGALQDALAKIRRFAPDDIIVSLGVDAYREDPLSFLKLDSDDYLKIGAAIAALRLPTLFVMEGGYAIDALGVNVANVLGGFQSAR